ncbi:MAG: hypothetical protein ABS95_01490 [Verrucomicrobia bacterium SCN 57-15]|nr:MAG: hypothetical protein ABS95_01490 [Verrucomicrobia bacterium SCN 57-15]
MSLPLPSIISEPSVLVYNGNSFYSKDGFKLNYKRDTFKVVSDMAGELDERLLRDSVEISWNPAGQITAINKFIPFTVADIGKSIFKLADNSVVIWTKSGKKHTWQRGAITKMPQLRLQPSDTLFGDMTITCIGKAATQPTDPAYFKAITSVPFADATFDETAILTAIYSAAWGAAPYAAMGAMNGFQIDIGMTTSTITCDLGIADITLSSLSAGARFAPSNLSEADMDALFDFQDAGAVLPGQSITKKDRDLVISSDVFSATIYKAGPKGYAQMFASGKQMHDAIEWGSRRTWAVGVADPLFALSVL